MAAAEPPSAKTTNPAVSTAPPPTTRVRPSPPWTGAEDGPWTSARVRPGESEVGAEPGRSTRPYAVSAWIEEAT